MKKVLFVCLGNICRSVAAEGLFNKMVEASADVDAKDFVVDSAGTGSYHIGSLADQRMRGAISRRGVTLTHRARQFREADYDKFDMVIVMDDYNYEHCARMAPSRDHLNKLYRMAEFSSNADVTHIPDPYYEGLSGFDVVLDLLEDCCTNLLEKIKKEAN